MKKEAVQNYFDQISDKRLLSREEETELAKKIERGDKKARDKLAERNLKLVISIAKKYKDYEGLSFLDLIQAGNIGLMKAIDKFDWRKGYKFSTYATWWIRQRILRELNKRSRTVRLPAHMHTLIRKMNKAEVKLKKEEKEVNTDNLTKKINMLEETNIPEEKIKQARVAAQRTKSLNKPLNEDEKFTRLSRTKRKRKTKPEKESNTEQLREILTEILTENPDITDREERIMKLRYGIEDFKERTLTEVGDILDISRERVRQIQERAIGKLENYFVEYPAKKKRAASLMES